MYHTFRENYDISSFSCKICYSYSISASTLIPSNCFGVHSEEEMSLLDSFAFTLSNAIYFSFTSGTQVFPGKTCHTLDKIGQSIAGRLINCVHFCHLSVLMSGKAYGVYWNDPPVLFKDKTLRNVKSSFRQFLSECGY